MRLDLRALESPPTMRRFRWGENGSLHRRALKKKATKTPQPVLYSDPLPNLFHPSANNPVHQGGTPAGAHRGAYAQIRGLALPWPGAS